MKILPMGIFALSVATLLIPLVTLMEAPDRNLPIPHTPVLSTSQTVLPTEVSSQEPETVQTLSSSVNHELGQQYFTDSVEIFDYTTGRKSTISTFDFVVGALAVEMSTSFEMEALKAQAVAAHTYMIYVKEMQEISPDPKHYGADISVNSLAREGFMTNDQIRDWYGDNYDEAMEILTEAATVGMNTLLVYEGDVALAAYHSTSAGTTEDAKNVWSRGFDYLAPVDSPGDLLASSYKTEEMFTDDELERLLVSYNPEIVFGEDVSEWIIPNGYSDSGYVTSVKVGAATLHGTEFREALSLRSSNFDIDYEDGVFTIVTYGYGHGVGMSQYGAQYMAEQGSSYEDILRHYYTGVELVTREQ